MSKLFSILGVLFLFSLSVFGQVPALSPAALAQAVVSVGPSPAPVGFFAFVKTNLAAIALAVYAVLDVLILVSPSLAGNGLIHQIILFSAKLSGQTPPAQS